MSTHLRVSSVLLAGILLTAMPLRAQTVDDGIMLGRGELQAGSVYAYDTWDEYWEGTLKRRNGNIGRITTQTNVFTANYALRNRVNVIANVPYVWTRASQGVLHGSRGIQDLGITVKWKPVEKEATRAGTLRAVIAVSGGLPLTDYNVELLPLSIGLHSRRLAGRGTLHLQSARGWFTAASAAYAIRGHVKLDRPYFFTDGEFTMSDHVDMPNNADYMLSGGYMRTGLMLAAFYGHQNTLGGGDIRKQDMPFVSNRMNMQRVGGMSIIPVPRAPNFAVQLGVAHTLHGRNVGQGTTVTTGLLYRLLGGRTR
jgi:hypothetical protein